MPLIIVIIALAINECGDQLEEPNQTKPNKINFIYLKEKKTASCLFSNNINVKN